MNISSKVSLALAIAAAACSSTTTSTPGASHADAATTTSVDSGSGAVVLARFDKSKGQLPEGLAIGTDHTIVTDWSPVATLVSVDSAQPIATAGAAANTFTLGIVQGPDGAWYFGVGAASAVGGAPADAGPVTPSPGIYRVAPGGTTADLFSLGSAASPGMSFANGLAFAGDTLFVTDSEGAIYTIDSSGAAQTWSTDPLLAPSQPACGGIVPLAVGVNGLVVTATDVYVTNTNYGRLIDIPIASDGSAGTAKVIAEDCAKLAGADGLLQAPDGSFIVAVNAQNRIARVTAAGAISTIAEGAPLDTPASVVLDSTASPQRLLVTSSSFFSAADAGSPGVVALPYP